VLNWTTSSAWVQEASRYIINGVILGFAGILAVQALKPPQRAEQNR
jgi:H+/Cl- antiporter ClcA